MRPIAYPLVLAAALFTYPAAAQETPVPVSAQRDLALTIYSGGFTVVQDTRRLRVAEGENVLAWEEVSRQAESESAMFGGLSGPPMTLIEQNFDFDLLTPKGMLERSVGQEVTIVRKNNPATGERIEETAEVISTNGGIVLRIGDRYHTQPPGRIVFHSLPEGLRIKPTLVARLRSENAGTADLRLTYHTGGLGWAANYVGEFDEAAGRMRLESRVVLENQTGIPYRDAALRLIAGEVRRSRQPRRAVARAAGQMAAEDMAQEVDAGGADFHVFEIGRRVTLENNQTKQIGFLPAMDIAVTPEYRFDGSGHYYRGTLDQKMRSNAAVWLTFENTEENGAGRALAAGTLRVYRDVAGQTTFMGAAPLGNTPVGEDVRLHLASAFDITAERVQTEYEVERPRERNRPTIVTTAFRITVKNAKDRDIEVIVTEPIPGDWVMLQESAPHERVSANRVEWRLPVPAGGETVLTYRVRFK